MIKTSLTHKLIVVFSAILIAVVALNIIINGLLLSKVHRDKKIDSMKDLYTMLNGQYNITSDNTDVIDTVKDALDNDNLRVFIWDNSDNLIIDSLPFSNDRDHFPPQEMPTDRPTPSSRADSFRNPRRDFPFGRMELFVFQMEINDENILDESTNYTIFSFTQSGNYDQKNFYLRGYLSGGYKVLIQMPYASVDEAISIANTLLLIVGLTMLIIGIIVVSITSRTIAKPIKELSHIAKSMQNLDFSQKYMCNRTDEIGSLGQSINALSERLESTISELYEKNERLLLDNELKSRIDKMRKEFIANASHELKTPVALISGYAEGLSDNIVSDEESRKIYTDVIIEEAEKMNNIIHQMLDLMELDGSEAIIEGEVFSLSGLVEEAISAFDLIIKNKGINLSCNYEGKCIVKGDYYRLRQAVTNYLSNAINHTTGENIIRVLTKETDDKVIFSVYNSGVVIPQEDSLNIWERFYKVDKAHTREYGGSGLGLSIVRSIIELHGGEFGFSNLSDGVEFYFILNKQGEKQ